MCSGRFMSFRIEPVHGEEERMASSRMIGRGLEMARLRSMIDRACAGRQTTVLVRGEPGSGKSELLSALGALAADTGFQVAAVDAQGIPRASFAAANHALGHLLTTSAVSAPTAVRAPSTERVSELVESVRVQAQRAPVAICVDDVDHVDPWSLRWLLALTESTSPTRLLIAASASGFGAGHPMPWGAELAARAERIDLLGLPAAALAEFAATRCGVTLDEESATECRKLTGGNPSLLLFLLCGTNAAPTAEEVGADACSMVFPGAERWLGGLSEPALALARAVAVLGVDAEIAQAAELAQLAVPDALSMADELVGRCLLANRTPLAFRHPLLATMVVSGIPVGTRAALHLKAAEILRDGHFGMTPVARQLVAAGPLGQAWAVQPLRGAARQLAREGRAEDAVRHLHALLRERLPSRVRSDVLCELAALDPFVDPDHTVHQLNSVRQEVDEPEIATGYAVALAGLLTECGRPAEAVAALGDTADRLGPGAAEQSWRVRLHKAYVCLHGPGWLARTADPLDDLVTQAPPDDGARRELAGLRAVHSVASCEDRATAVHYARQALAGAPDSWTWSAWYGSVALIHADELDEAWTHLSRTRLAGGACLGRWDPVSAELLRARICRVRGDLAGVAEALTPMAEWLCTAAANSRMLAALGVSLLVEARSLMGDTDTALALLTDSGLDHDLLSRRDTPTVLCARAALWEHRGDPSSAVADYLAAGRLLAEYQADNPAVVPWRSRAARLLAAAGEVTEAAQHAGAELEHARRWGISRTIGIAEHGVAMAATGARRLRLLAGAVRTLACSPARLELAAARFDLAAALGEAGRANEAGTEFAAALSTARACGAQPLMERIRAARQALCPPGLAEPAHPTLMNLTPQELKILCLAREGHTNRAIAGKLCVTVRTVEFHLSGAYRKLGISGRRQLGEIIPSSVAARLAASKAIEDGSRQVVRPLGADSGPLGCARCG
ncbi:AAA family ATPase [Streptomyces sp. NPDC006476]|uniref:helix-turn-helix transcriptional regulator n=1 Tax=Streptomyces sp. NPDC006476 TaxID=3157175 RepID=UPI0033B0CEE0